MLVGLTVPAPVRDVRAAVQAWLRERKLAEVFCVLYTSPPFDPDAPAEQDAGPHPLRAKQDITFGRPTEGLAGCGTVTVVLDPGDLTGMDGFGSKLALVRSRAGLSAVVLHLSEPYVVTD